MPNSNTDCGSSGLKSDAQQGSKSRSGKESKSQNSDKSASSSEKQQDQDSSKHKSPGSTRGGTHEQHVKAGEQSHKNS